MKPRVVLVTVFLACIAVATLIVLWPAALRDHTEDVAVLESHPTPATAKTTQKNNTAASSSSEEPARKEDCAPVLTALETNHEIWTAKEVSSLTSCIWALDSEFTAEELLVRALKVEPANPALVDDLTQIYRQQRRFAEAIAVLERAIGINEAAELHQALAATKWHMATSVRSPDDEFKRLVTEAGDSWVRVAELDPSHAPAAYEMAADAFLEFGDFGKGAEVLERGINAILQHPEEARPQPLMMAFMYLRLSDLLLRAGQAGTALGYSDQALQLPLSQDERTQVEARRAELQSMAYQ